MYHKVHHPRCVHNKLDWSVRICLRQIYGGRDMYRIYYIKINYMFRHFTLAIFRLRNIKELSNSFTTVTELANYVNQTWSTIIINIITQ